LTVPPRITANAALWGVLALLCIVLSIAFPNRVWLLLSIALCGVCLISWFWTYALARGLLLSREIRFGWVRVGDWLQERFTLTNTSRLPVMWAEIIDHSTFPNERRRAGSHPYVLRVADIGGRTRLRWGAERICTRRGLYILGPTRVQTGDPFGLFTTTIHLPDSAALLVLPPVLNLPMIEVAPGGRAEQGQRPVQHPFEQTVITSGVRSYFPGDSLRFIHWPLSARHNELHVRLFENTPSSDWWIVLDLEGRSQAGAEQDSTEEHGVILAASIASRGLREGHKVGLAALGKELIWLPPSGSRQQQMNILNALAVAQTGSHPLEKVLDGLRASLRSGASLILITPAVEGYWLSAFSALLYHKIIPTVLILDPSSFGARKRTADSLHNSLVNSGIHHYVITRDLLNYKEGIPGNPDLWQREPDFGRSVEADWSSDVYWRKLSNP